MTTRLRSLETRTRRYRRRQRPTSDYPLNIFFNPAELSSIRRAARVNRTSARAFIHRAAVEEARRINATPVDIDPAPRSPRPRRHPGRASEVETVTIFLSPLDLQIIRGIAPAAGLTPREFVRITALEAAQPSP